MATYSSKSYKVRDMHCAQWMTWNIAIQKGKIYYIKIKIIGFITNFGGNRAAIKREM